MNTDYFKDWMVQQTQMRRLLLIDDSVEDCVLIQRMTYRYHCEWMIANNFGNALYCLENMAPIGGFSLIFLDLHLGGGGMDGIAVFKEIKTRWPKIPIVILSGHLTNEAISEITSFSFALFAQKPNSFTDRYFEELFQIIYIPRKPGIETTSPSI